MTVPHPETTGSLGGDFASWVKDQGGELRWWQEFAGWMILQTDSRGRLVWRWVLLSTARQLGKSTLIRWLAMWRIHQADRIGEEQTVLHTARDIAVVKEVQRPARLWAKAAAQKAAGYVVRETNGQEMVEAPDGSRWMARSREACYGYSASMAVCDEAHDVQPAVVEDGLEPTMAARMQPMGLLASTAHSRPTPLFPVRRAQAVAQLGEPSDMLLLEWSADPDLGDGDVAGWRQASPFWDAGRERLMRAKFERALIGDGDDQADEDPLTAFRSQWLNRWPSMVKPVERFMDPDAWDACGVDEPPVRDGELLVAAVDQAYEGTTFSVVHGWRLPDGRVWVSLAEFDSLDQALGSVDADVWLVGVSLLSLVDKGRFHTAPRPYGSRETGPASAELLRAVNGGRLLHGRDPRLGRQVAGSRKGLRETGSMLSSGKSDVDVTGLKLVGWLVHGLANQRNPLATDRPAIFI